MKDKQINVRLSMEDVRRLKELAAPFGGISNWIRAVLDSGVTGADERSLVHVPEKPRLSTHLKGWALKKLQGFKPTDICMGCRSMNMNCRCE